MEIDSILFLACNWGKSALNLKKTALSFRRLCPLVGVVNAAENVVEHASAGSAAF